MSLKKEIPKATKNYLRAVAKSKRVHERQSGTQRTQDDENRRRKRKYQAEQIYELQDPALERPNKTRTIARPMTLVLRELRQSQDARLVHTDILARGLYADDDNGEQARLAYLAIRGHCELWTFQKEVVRFIEARESDEAEIHCRSLMLCIDMSLGKTIISLTYLLVDNQRCCRQTGRRFNGCTLIVCQNALLVENWLDEVRQKWPINAFQYHRLYSSKNRLISRFYIENCCDFLIVTYATIKAAYRYASRDHDGAEEADEDEEEEDEEEEEGGGGMRDTEKVYKYELLYKTRWKRIIADESHVFVNRHTVLYKAMMTLEAEIKWVVTGTPIQNSLSDICSSFNFIGIPLGNRIEHYLDKHEHTGSAAQLQLLEKIRETLAVVMIRRLKHEIPRLGDGELTHAMPPFFMPVVKTIKLIEFETHQERVLYYLYATYGSRKWRTESDEKTKSTTTSIASILQLMMQLCLGPRIVENLTLPHGLLTMPHDYERRLSLRDTPYREALFDQSTQLEYASHDKTLEYFASQLSRRTVFTYRSESSLLNLPAEYKVEYHDRLGSAPITDLSHLETSKNAETLVWEPFRSDALFDLEHSETDRARYQLLYDHLCAHDQDDETLKTLARECEDPQALAMIGHLMARTLRRTQSSSKNRHIIRYIQETRADDKVLIFSNSVRWLETMASDLTECGITSILVSGKTHRDNTERIARYKNPHAQIKVLLLSFKLGNVGINIPEANIIIFPDPWWNPNMLEQAENRVQRPGQTKTVHIVYFILNRTIDLYVLNRSYDKKYMTTSLMNTNSSNDEESQPLTRYAYSLYEYGIEQ